MVHSQRGARQALYIYEPGSFVPLATIQERAKSTAPTGTNATRSVRRWS